MMNKLSKDTAQLLSSLQVIAKVEGVVKELVENALDAGATCIEVKFENYGLTRIEVRDNGTGIKQDGVEFAAQRHYTSKITSTTDLATLSTYGFRGEALSSLCRVADVFITTRTETDHFSSKYSFNDKGIITAVKPSHLAQGTTVVASKIFHKMPVRLQYYQTESKKKLILKNTEDILTAFGLIHPEKKFTFLHNKSVVWQKPSCKNWQTALQNIVGPQIASQMIEVHHHRPSSGISVSAIIPTTTDTRHFRKSADKLFLFVNKRPVRDKEIENLIKQHTCDPQAANSSANWPLAILKAEIPTQNVDVNVESDKSTVFIDDKASLHEAIDVMLKEAYASIQEQVDKKKEAEGNLSTAKHASSVHDATDCGRAKNQDPNDRGVLNRVCVGDMASNLVNMSATNDPAEKGVGHPGTAWWSKGRALDSHGECIEPVGILVRDLARNKSLDESLPMRPSNRDGHSVISKTSWGKNASTPSRKSHSARESRSGYESLASWRISLSPVCSSTPKSTQKDSSCRRPVGHRTPSIANWISKTDKENRPMDTSSQDTARTNNTFPTHKYFDGQERTLKFDFDSVKRNFSMERAGIEKDPCFTSVGLLKDVKGGVVFDGTCKALYLVNILRLQEMKIFTNLMESHSVSRRRLPDPIDIYTTNLSFKELTGLEVVRKSSTDSGLSDFEIEDDRILKNGFQVVSYPDYLRVLEMSSVVPYLNIGDLKEILHKIGTTSDLSVTESRPFKTVQYLQAEAVRISTSTPVHSSVLENCLGIKKQNVESIFEVKCFHNKPLFSLLHHLEKS